MIKRKLPFYELNNNLFLSKKIFIQYIDSYNNSQITSKNIITILFIIKFITNSWIKKMQKDFYFYSKVCHLP
jgi:hypothetical protein